MISIRLWLVLYQTQQITHQHDDRDFSDGRDVDRSFFFDVRVKVLRSPTH